MELKLAQLHKYPNYLQSCCNLINSEWKRSDTARLRSLESSCDELPTSLILLRNEELLGHAKLSPIPSISNSCFLESVIIDQKERGKGFGRLLMEKVEDYCFQHLDLDVIYLSTKGQEIFYQKLGYVECAPVSIYGGPLITNNNMTPKVDTIKHLESAALQENIPKPPTLPKHNFYLNTTKTYFMKKCTDYFLKINK